MNTIKNIPYAVATFDKQGNLIKADAIPAGTTDLLVMSHGWRNDETEATKLYTDFFTNFADPTIVPPAGFAGRKFVILGIFWPSKNFDGLVAAQGASKAGDAAAIGVTVSDQASQQKVRDQLEELKKTGIFDEPSQREALSKAQACIPNLDNKTTARTEFVSHLRSLMDPSAANKEDASDIFLKIDPTDLFNRLNFHAQAVDPAIPRTGKAMALSPGAVIPPTGHAAGLLDIFQGAAAAASNAVSYLSYYMMKERAGLVGMNGVAPLIDQLAPQVTRIHLIGHSFGGRVVAATALASKNTQIHSLAFLQAAFSHNGFSPVARMNGLFRPVFDPGRANGPIIATHTKNDTAVGIAYPLASRLSGTVAAALGDQNDKYGGLGRNGAQQMNPGEVIPATLLHAGDAYALTPRKFHNLLADAFIKNHNAITGREVVAATAAAIL